MHAATLRNTNNTTTCAAAAPLKPRTIETTDQPRVASIENTISFGTLLGARDTVRVSSSSARAQSSRRERTQSRRPSWSCVHPSRPCQPTQPPQSATLMQYKAARFGTRLSVILEHRGVYQVTFPVGATVWWPARTTQPAQRYWVGGKAFRRTNSVQRRECACLELRCSAKQCHECKSGALTCPPGAGP